jgi:hypothetical protein
MIERDVLIQLRAWANGSNRKPLVFTWSEAGWQDHLSR